MKRILSISRVICVVFLSGILTLSVYASTTDGTIDATYKTAKIIGTVGGYINFGATYGNVHVTDTALTGYAWGENTGWINLSPTNGGVANTSEGVLSGYAWGERIGWINFNPTNGGVIINSSGEFTGYAWGERIGWISFNCSTESTCGTTNYKVKTDWRPESVRNAATPSNPGSSPGGTPPISITPPIQTPPPSVQNPIIPPTFQASNPTQGPSSVLPSVQNPNTPPIDSPQNSVGPNDSIGLVEAWKNSSERIVREIQTGGDALRSLYQNPVIDTTTKIISTLGVVGLLVAGISSAVLSAISFSEIILLPFRLWTLLLSFLGLKKKSKPWGTVYDSITKQPLDPAYVVLKGADGSEIDTSITDLDGRYGFLAGNGTYTVIANKTHYTFPSTRLAGKISDELYTNLYFGEQISTSVGTVIDRNIPLDPQNFDWNEFAKSDKKLMKFYSRGNRLLLRMSDWLFRLGAIMALISLYAVPEPYNLIIFIVYVILFALRIVGLRPRTFGSLVEQQTGNPLSFAVIRVISSVANTEIAHKVADMYGRYYCLVPKGTYSVRIEKKNLDETYSVVAEIPQVFATKGIINQTFTV